MVSDRSCANTQALPEGQPVRPELQHFSKYASLFPVTDDAPMQAGGDPDADAQGKDDGAGDDGHDEFQGRTKPGPPNPTTREVDHHEASGHAVYRMWCSDCIQGRGRCNMHRQVNHEGETVPVLSWDYGFLATRG